MGFCVSTALWDMMLIAVIVPSEENTATSFDTWFISQKTVIMALSAIRAEIVTDLFSSILIIDTPQCDVRDTK